MTRIPDDRQKQARSELQDFWDQLKADPSRAEELRIFESVYVCNGELISPVWYAE